MRIALFRAKSCNGEGIEICMRAGFEALGHEVELFDPDEEYDMILLTACLKWSQVDYSNLHELDGRKFALIDFTIYNWFTHYPHYARNCLSIHSPACPAPTANTNDMIPPTADGVIPWNQYRDRGWDSDLASYLENKSYPYFRREMNKNFIYPYGYHPIEYPIDPRVVESASVPQYDEFVNRQDIHCRLGYSHPFRHRIMRILKKMNRSGVYKWFNSNNLTNRLDRGEFYKEMNACKLNVTHSGAGTGTMRQAEGMVHGAMFQEKHDLYRWIPLVDGINFVEYEVDYVWRSHEPGHGVPWFLGTNIDSIIEYYLDDLDALYGVYKRGYDFIRRRGTYECLAEYIIDIWNKQDWTRETEIWCLPKWPETETEAVFK